MQWEYDVVQLKGSVEKYVIPMLDAKGKQGWELVNVFIHPSTLGRNTRIWAIFKRPLLEEPPESQ